MNCSFCETDNSIIKNNDYYVCYVCGCIRNYIYSVQIDNNLIKNCSSYKRLTYLSIIINNINLKYIDHKNENVIYLYNTYLNDIKFNYKLNKIMIKKDRKQINFNVGSHYNSIYYMMFLKFNDDYLFIDEELKHNIFKIFFKIENQFNDCKKRCSLLRSRKKKIINYSFLLYKIMQILNLEQYHIYLDLPNIKILNILNTVWQESFISIFY